MTGDKSRYSSYLLRLWLEMDEAETTWRASLEETHTGERQGFISLEALYAFILEQTRHIVDQSNKIDTSASAGPKSTSQ